jgi:hypothetical protein
MAQAMAPFGVIQSVDASAVASESDGVATVHFFDVRAIELAVACIHGQHMRRAAWASCMPRPPQPWDWLQCRQRKRSKLLGLGASGRDWCKITCSVVCCARSVVDIITSAANELNSRLTPNLSLHCIIENGHI